MKRSNLLEDLVLQLLVKLLLLLVTGLVAISLRGTLTHQLLVGEMVC